MLLLSFLNLAKKQAECCLETSFIEMAKKAINPTRSLKIPQFIIISAKICAFVSKNLATKFAARIFTTPIKHKVPKREFEMNSKSNKTTIHLPAINKNITIYQYGQSENKVLLVHGWSGRGTQLFKIADELVHYGYSTISFDAPAHGKSEGKTTIMSEFIASILEIEKQFGPFEIAIGHSLGGMSVLNAIKDGLKVNKAVVIGSGDIIQDILDEFILKLKLQKEFSEHLRLFFENKYQVKMDDFSAYRAAQKVKIPVLVIHDNDDPEVSVKAGIHIHQNLENGTLFLTDGLGHRKILGNQNVIKRVLKFIKND